jgi:xanthine dehydrogenase YagR molybdenum-binding subunit
MTVTEVLRTSAVGAPVERVDARLKVQGRARYAAEHRAEDVAHARVVGAPVARGRVAGIDVEAALALPGVLAVLWADNAPRVAPVTDPHLQMMASDEMLVMQSPQIAYRGQIVACVVAETPEAAAEAADRLDVRCEEDEHDVVLTPSHPRLREAPMAGPGHPATTAHGDVEGALARAEVTIDATYTTPATQHVPMEPHGALALWSDGSLTVYDSSQGASLERDLLAALFGLEPHRVRVISEFVGGGFGSKGGAAPHVIAASMAALAVGRPVKLSLTRHQSLAICGYRSPTIQRVRIGAARDGRLAALDHDVAVQTSTVKLFVEGAGLPSRMMYAAESIRTSHRVAALDVPTPTWMRAPGEAPGMFALESAIDEVAVACGIDPIELRLRNEPPVDPESGLPWSSRNLVACLREGAERFGWALRDPAPRARAEGRLLIGSGVAAATFPAFRMPSSATVRAEPDGTFLVRIAAADIGTGARTVLGQIAADALGAPLDRVVVEIGDSALPPAFLAGGSAGTASWGSAVVAAARALRAQLDAGAVPGADGLEATADTAQEIAADERAYSSHSFGAQFAEVAVDQDTGEVRVRRLLGVFAPGRIINPRTARSQLVGGMVWGLSMALHEHSEIDARYGDYVQRDLAAYHVAAHADVAEIDAVWIDEDDPHLGPIGAKGIGEIGIVGVAAAIANAVHHATGVRIRDLPIGPARLVGALAVAARR